MREEKREECVFMVWTRLTVFNLNAAKFAVEGCTHFHATCSGLLVQFYLEIFRIELNENIFCNVCGWSVSQCSQGREIDKDQRLARK